MVKRIEGCFGHFAIVWVLWGVVLWYPGLARDMREDQTTSTVMEGQGVFKDFSTSLNKQPQIPKEDMRLIQQKLSRKVI